MNIPINKDLEEEYKNEFVKGYTFRETGYIALALVLVIGIGALAYLKFHLPIEACVYAGIPFAIPVVLLGFKKMQGLTMGEYLKELIWEKRTKVLTYDADEVPDNGDCFSMKNKNQW